MKQQPQNQASGASETTRFFCTRISSAAGAAGAQQQHKKEPHLANKNTNPGGGKNADSGVVHNPQSSRAHTRTRGMSYGAINNIPLSAIPRACAHVHETGGKPHSKSALAQWRTNTFGGDFDPVRVAVDEAVSTFSMRQPEDDRRIWLKIANEIGYEAFRDLYLEQCAIMRECKLRNPSAAFQNRLNRYTGHNSGKGGAA